MGARDTERRQQTAFESAFRFSALIKPDGEVLQIDRQALGFWQLSEQDVNGKRFWDIGWRLVQDDGAQRLQSAVRAAADGRIVRREAAVWHHGEQRAALSFSLRPLRDRNGQIVVLIADVRNLTRRQQVETALQRALGSEPADAERARAALAHVEDAVVVTDAEGKIEHLNPAAAELFGDPPEPVADRPLDELLGVLGAAAAPLREHVMLSRGEADVSPQSYAFLLETAIGQLTVRARYAPIAAGGFVLVLRSEPVAGTAAAAGKDALTGLLDRGGLLAQLGRAVREDGAAGRRHTLCYIDLDGFEQVNREIGSGPADEALRQVAQELRGHARHGDLVARLEDDDFALLLRDCTSEDAATVAEALLRGIHELRIAVEGPLSPLLSASAGLAEMAADLKPRGWIKAARRACMEAKEAGGNQLRVAAAQAAAPKNAGFDADRLRLFQQPLVALDGIDGIGHTEVLLRLRADDGDWGAPREFLAGAERADLMPEVDRWVIRNVFAHARQRQDAAAPANYSINLSPASLADPGLLDFIRGEHAATGLDPASISFEIGESDALDDLGRARGLIDDLHQSGFRVTLDDCGDAGRPLAYLRDLPVDYMKIGGALMRDMVDDPVSNVMVDAINRIGHLTGKRTIGKFVENDATVRRLRSLRVDYAQGFGLAEPTPLGPEPG